MTNFRNLKIWQKGMEIVINVYKLSEMLPKLVKIDLMDHIINELHEEQKMINGFINSLKR